MTPDDVDKVVAQLNDNRRHRHFRNPDRPDSVFVKLRDRRPAEVIRAQGRIRTASYRNALDRRCAPTNAQIGQAMVLALVTGRLDDVTEADRGLVGRALLNLRSRGFDIVEAKLMLRRLRNRLVDPADWDGESRDNGVEAITPTAWGDDARKMPF